MRRRLGLPVALILVILTAVLASGITFVVTDTSDPPPPEPTPLPTPTPDPAIARPFPANGKIKEPGIYTGSISNPSGDCVEVTIPGVVIRDAEIGPCDGRGVYFHDADSLTILDSTIDNDVPTDLPRCDESGGCEHYTTVLAENAANLVVRRSTLARGESLIELIDVDGALIVGNVGLDPRGPFPRGQFLQTQGATRDVIFLNNTYTCDPSAGCLQEDAVNLFRGSNILIEGNDIDSGGGLGRSSGCGIITEGVETATIRGNTLRNQYFGALETADSGCGIGIASGVDILVEGNYVEGYGNVGYYVHDFSGWSGGCSRITVRNNVAGTRIDGQRNSFSSGSDCQEVTATGNSWQAGS